MKRFNIYYTGMITIEAETEEEAEDKFNYRYYDYGDIEDIEEILEERDD